LPSNQRASERRDTVLWISWPVRECRVGMSGRKLELDEHGGENILSVAEAGDFGQTASLKRLNKEWNGCGWRGRIFCSIWRPRIRWIELRLNRRVEPLQERENSRAPRRQRIPGHVCGARSRCGIYSFTGSSCFSRWLPSLHLERSATVAVAMWSRPSLSPWWQCCRRRSVTGAWRGFTRVRVPPLRMWLGKFIHRWGTSPDGAW